MTDLTPTPERPGLHINPARGRAAAVCHCGASATATGDAEVRALVSGWEANHGSAHDKERK
jgi:hypothetical protein